MVDTDFNVIYNSRLRPCSGSYPCMIAGSNFRKINTAIQKAQSGEIPLPDGVTIDMLRQVKALRYCMPLSQPRAARNYATLKAADPELVTVPGLDIEVISEMYANSGAPHSCTDTLLYFQFPDGPTTFLMWNGTTADIPGICATCS